mmetsp:Transcript_55973/g.133376  ORF Transcript_55973/g.133376 Transcript_55973/m.133376 type:complete len:129 (-) Transcript_55973:77-463(-)
MCNHLVTASKETKAENWQMDALTLRQKRKRFSSGHFGMLCHWFTIDITSLYRLFVTSAKKSTVLFAGVFNLPLLVIKTDRYTKKSPRHVLAKLSSANEAYNGEHSPINSTSVLTMLQRRSQHLWYYKV